MAFTLRKIKINSHFCHAVVLPSTKYCHKKYCHKTFAFSECLLPILFWAFNTSDSNGAPAKKCVYLSCCYNWL